MVKVVAITVEATVPRRRLGFMAGAFSVPDDFDRLGDDAIGNLFGGDV